MKVTRKQVDRMIAFLEETHAKAEALADELDPKRTRKVDEARRLDGIGSAAHKTVSFLKAGIELGEYR